MWLLSLAPRELWGGNVWAVVSTGQLDPRVARQLDELAGRERAQVRYFSSLDPASHAGPKILIEFYEEDLDSFSRLLDHTLSVAAMSSPPAAAGNRIESGNGEITVAAAERRIQNGDEDVAATGKPELKRDTAQQGYVIEAAYRHSVPSRIRITVARDVAFNYALRRVPTLFRVKPSKLASSFDPPPRSLRVEESGRRVVLADYPSFPERGIVEGFYGAPWTQEDRLEMLRFEGRHGMNAYFYAPKDDPYHRKLWREPYPPREIKRLAELVNAARQNFVDFCFAISPGLSMVYSSDDDFAQLVSKLESVGRLGVSCFALFLDDVPPDLQNLPDQARFRSLAEAHVYLINRLNRYLKSQSRENRLVVTPTTYTNEWGSRDYIREVGAEADPDVAIAWTGPRVVSPAITRAEAQEWGELLHRPPLLWDNFPVNDGITWRLNLGPLVGRDPALPAEVAGLVANPMNQARASMIPLETVADYLWNSSAYDPQRSLGRALAEQYGNDAASRLAPFLKAYGDYWWDESIFKPLFVEEHKPFDTREIERRLARLDSSLKSLRHRTQFHRLVRDLAPFPVRTRERLAQVRADPAFRRLPNQELQWRDDYDVLYAARAGVTPVIDGDFAKWQSGPLYLLGEATQIVAGAKLWRGPDQFSARVGLAWDDSYLYVGAEFTDPDLYQPFSGRGIDKGDVLILTLETAFQKNFVNTQAGGDEYRLLFSPGDFSATAPSLFSDEDYLPPRPVPRDYNHEIKTAWKKTPTGFSADIALPAGWFYAGPFQADYEIGLSFAAQKVLRPLSPGNDNTVERIIFTSKSDRLFPVRFSNPSTYQRLVLIRP